MIPFNKPAVVGSEFKFMQDALHRGHISGNGFYTKLCHQFFEQKYQFSKCLLTTSGTAALEMCALLCDIQPGDEVIMPSFTFPSMANAFVMRGAAVVFIDCESNIPNIDAALIEQAITPKTRAIVVVHYSGFACNMEKICALALKYNLFLVEDCAHALDSYYRKKALGSFGHFAAFSFHETKNITCGEGGMLVINDQRFHKRAEILWEKGTNRAAFFKGEVDRYSWVDIGSSYVLSDLNAAYLYAQLLALDQIQHNRIASWNKYVEELQKLIFTHKIAVSLLNEDITNNANSFYIITQTSQDAIGLLTFLTSHKVMAVSHYQPLHSSPFGRLSGYYRELPNTDAWAEKVIRLPLYYGISQVTISNICKLIRNYFE
ncbi:MAG: dTDP-4-amino-4,6-dideoxygalactose transaminase [Chitinophagales bacterium]